MCKVSIKIFKCGTVISLILHQFSAFGLTNNGSGACTKIVHVYYRRYFTKFINILNLKVLNLKNFDCPCFNGKLQLWKRLFFSDMAHFVCKWLSLPPETRDKGFSIVFYPHKWLQYDLNCYLWRYDAETVHIVHIFIIKFKSTVFCQLKLRFHPEIRGSRQIKIFLFSKRVFNMLRIVTYQDRMPNLYLLSSFSFLY